MSITLSMPPQVVEDARAYAAKNGTSINRMIREYLIAVVGGDGAGENPAAAIREIAVSHKKSRHGVSAPYRFRRSDAYDREM